MKTWIILLGAIGFFSSPVFAQDEPVEPVQEIWTDPVTGGDWSFAHPALNWFDALEACGEDFALPDHPTIAHALRRLKNTFIAERLRDADTRLVWSNEEVSWRSAMVVRTTNGSASGEYKRYLHAVLCYRAN